LKLLRKKYFKDCFKYALIVSLNIAIVSAFVVIFGSAAGDTVEIAIRFVLGIISAFIFFQKLKAMEILRTLQKMIMQINKENRVR
jgi:magnesium-transporting ATPase (P-type)